MATIPPLPMPPRAVFAAVAALCAGLFGASLYFQHIVGLEPCPMCIIQRFAFVVIGVVAAVAAIHGPGALGQKIYSAPMALIAVGGGGTSVRQSWIQRFPDPTGSCGADLGFLLDNFPLTQALPKIFAGSGDCSTVSWRFLGLSMAEWAFFWFLLFLSVAVWLFLAKRK